jgi:uncharacterized membrane protein YkvA (DUF1232 family)
MAQFVDSLVSEVKQYQGPEADLVKLAPSLFKALANLLDDPSLDPSLRLQVAAALGYFVAPFDAVPDAEGAAGYLDDIFVALHVLRAARDSAGDGVMDIAWPDQGYSSQKLDEWYDRTQRILGNAVRGALRFIGLDLAPTDV